MNIIVKKYRLKNMAEKKIKAISHIERLINSESYNPESHEWPTKVKDVVCTKGIDPNTGLVVAKREVVEKELGEDYKDLKWTDFGIEQLQISGAVGMLNNVSTLSGVNGIAQADYIDRVGNSVTVPEVDNKNIEVKE